MMDGAPSILIVDDQPAICTALKVLFEIHDLTALAVHTPEQALELVRSEDIGVVIQDMNFRDDTTSGKEGIELFRALKSLDPDLPILLMTAWTSVETAVALVKEGADDYLAKPWDDDKLLRTVSNLLRIRQLQLDNTRLRARDRLARSALATDHDLCGVIYQSDAMHAVTTLAVNVAPSDAPVLITGPNGAGKEKLSEIVHANSRRHAHPMITVNAGGLPDELLEAELFGAEAGAFTGAHKQRVGRFEAANRGTLFLDEIGNLTLAGQAKLLRVLQSGEFQRLGSSQTRRADVRIISATNADLPRRIAEGSFREDLYFRLAVIELRVPPLRERTDDILPLADYFLSRYSAEQEPTRYFCDAARSALAQHEWPGNVRELQNRVQRATLVGAAAEISADDLGLTGAPPIDGNPTAPSTASSATDPERIRVEQALVANGGVVSRAAAQLGLSRQALYRRMERLGIVLERKLR